jgi:hypothetical protein
MIGSPFRPGPGTGEPSQRSAFLPMARGRSLLFMVSTLTSLVAVTLIAPAAAQQRHAAWKKCSIARGDAAAREAGIWRALDHDPTLRSTFSEVRSTRSVYGRPSTSLCGDFNGDGRLDRAVHYQCCTVSSPAPWVVLRRQAGRWRIAYKRLHDTTWELKGDGTELRTTEPKYSRSDVHCCPSHLRIGTLRWTGARFKRTFQIVDPNQESATTPPEEGPPPTETQPPG